MQDATTIAAKVRDALRAERDVLRDAGNDPAAEAITNFLFEAGTETCVRLYQLITADAGREALK